MIAAGQVARQVVNMRPGQAVREVGAATRELVRAFKEQVLQLAVEIAQEEALGPRRKRHKPQWRTPWSCPRCGPRRGDQIRRNGHYRRFPLTREGVASLVLPQLLCADCGRAVPFELEILPRRKRLWLDVDHLLTQLYVEGLSYRACRRYLEGESQASLGLMSLWRALQRVAEGKQAVASRSPLKTVGLDELHNRVQGQSQWLLSARGLDQEGRPHWLGAVLSPDKSQEAWEKGLDALGLSGERPAFTLLADGDAAIEAAVERCLPHSSLQRCVWHIKHNAAQWIQERHPTGAEAGVRRGLMAAVHAVVDASDQPSRRSSLTALAGVAPWLAQRLGVVLQRVGYPSPTGPPRTNNLLERGFREWRRRTRPMDGFGSRRGLRNFARLWMIKENARLAGRPWMQEVMP